jgi:GT2 family glycosyltransferase
VKHLATASVLTVILNYKTPEMTFDSAKAAYVAMEGVTGRIVVVDNGSQDGSFEKLSALVKEIGWPSDRVQVIDAGHNGGFGAGNNAGILYGLETWPEGGAPDYVYILNSDAFPEKDAIALLVDHLENHPKTGFAGSHIVGEDNDAHHTAFRFPSVWGELEGAAKVGVISRLLSNHIVPLDIPEANKTVDWLAGASILMRLSTLEQTGLFDETFFLYYEETDLCMRAKRAGWAVDYVRDSKVVHIGSQSTGMKNWSRIPAYWFESRQYYFCKNHGKVYSGMATFAHLCGAMIWRMRRVLGRKPKNEPDHFLRDLVSHELAALFSFQKPSQKIPMISTSGSSGLDSRQK